MAIKFTLTYCDKEIKEFLIEGIDVQHEYHHYDNGNFGYAIVPLNPDGGDSLE